MVPPTPPSPAPPGPGDDLVGCALVERAQALLAEQEGVLDSDPESVHRMRVASRRVRETVRLATPRLSRGVADRLLREGRRVTRALGGLREEQVSRAILLRLSRGASRGQVEAVGFDYLLERLDRRITRGFARAGRRLRRIDLKRFEKRLLAAALRPSPTAAAVESQVLVEPLTLAAEEHLKAAREHQSDENLHQLRIALKRLRYAVEVLAGRGDAGSRLGRALKRLQDALGDHHDLAVLAVAVAEERGKLIGAGRTALADAVGAVSRRVLEAKRDALGPLGTRMKHWPEGSLHRRVRRAVRAAAKVRSTGEVAPLPMLLPPAGAAQGSAGEPSGAA